MANELDEAKRLKSVQPYKDELMELIPSECPDCREHDDREWQEFTVFLADVFYFNTADRERRSYIDAHIKAVCTRCDAIVLDKRGIDI